MTEKDPGSITGWLQQLQRGDHESAARIWKRFYPRLVQLASQKMRHSVDHSEDGEDAAHSALHKVLRCITAGKYADLNNRTELWNMLFVATMNRVRSHYRRQQSQKNPVTATEGLDSQTGGMEDFSSPETETQLADLLEFLMRRLDDEDPSGELRTVAALHLDQHSASDIARILRRRKTVILQKIRLIRIIWVESGSL
jgi:DNA-directed RNA polymerase specialized sigma24 family protein